MSKRLYPYRDYDEHEVINLFALNTANNQSTDDGNGDSGVIVKVSAGDLNSNVIEHITSSYLGKTDYGTIGRVRYPEVPLKIAVAGTGDIPLGITLKETAMYDENNEKYLYYKQKAIEMDIVLSGQAVPVLTRGVVMLDQAAFVANTVPAVGVKLVVGSGASGQFAEDGGAYDNNGAVVGLVLATGSRVAGITADQFAGAALSTGKYAMVQLKF